MIKLKSEKNRGERIINRKMKEMSEEITNNKIDPMFWYERGFTVTHEEMFGDV